MGSSLSCFTPCWANSNPIQDVNHGSLEVPSESTRGSNSWPPTVFCKICMESNSIYDSFSTQSCSHVFCSECIRHHIASKVAENCTVVKCPEEKCKAVLEPELCRPIIPSDVFELWCKLLCEESISETRKVYCPYRECSALLLDDEREGKDEVVKQVQCPHCRRLFCAQCKVPWHKGIRCAEYQKFGNQEAEKEDIMLRNLAKANTWGRCPKCRYYVEKSGGCSYMMCRCKHRFCYYCGAHREKHNSRCHACKR